MIVTRPPYLHALYKILRDKSSKVPHHRLTAGVLKSKKLLKLTYETCNDIQKRFTQVVAILHLLGAAEFQKNTLQTILRKTQRK